MGRDVNEHVKPPGRELPERPFEHEPNQQKRRQKHDEAVGHVVEMMDIQRDGRFRRRAMAEIGLFRKPQRGGCPENPEGKQIRGQSDREGQPKTRSTLAPERNCAPEAMGENIH